VADHVRREAIEPQLVFCSTALRARGTLAVLLPAFDGECEVRLEDGLYGATADELLARLRSVPDDVGSVLVVGHNPGLEELAARLGGDEGPERMPTSALFELQADGPWSALGDEPCRVAGVTIPR
jgi:phosphohistidine phosphatase